MAIKHESSIYVYFDAKMDKWKMDSRGSTNNNNNNDIYRECSLDLTQIIKYLSVTLMVQQIKIIIISASLTGIK